MGKNNYWSADGAGYSSDSDDWATLQAVFDVLDAEFGDLDVCAAASMTNER